MACVAELPHMSGSGCKLPHTAGRSGWPKIRQPLASSNCAQRTPAGLPFGMPGMGLEMEGAMQQAPQWGRQSMLSQSTKSGRKPLLCTSTIEAQSD